MHYLLLYVHNSSIQVVWEYPVAVVAAVADALFSSASAYPLV